jgi:formylglycine-generating enzyme
MRTTLGLGQAMASLTAVAFAARNRERVKKFALKVVRMALGAMALGAVAVQGAQFFRIVGPVPTTITALSVDGYLTWTNSPTNATFTIQTTRSLLNPTGWVGYIQVPVSNAVAVERIYDPNPPSGMVFIPAGSFTMGNCMTASEGLSTELPLHTVYVSALYMDKYLVTKSLWDDVYNWAITQGYSFDYGAQGKAATHPVHSMTFYDAVKWCNARSEKEGKTPAYYTDSGLSVPYRSGQGVPYVNWSSGYRLPTEAEWEKAARGGTAGHRYPWSGADTIDQSRANYYGRWSFPGPNYPYEVNTWFGLHPAFNDGVSPYTSPVGYFAPNGYGLYDMAGNLWQWCWDWFGSYSSGSQTDPRGPASGGVRVIRGGSWGTGAYSCRTAHRSHNDPATGYFDSGIRVVLPAGQ